MPAYDFLSDEELALILTHIRKNFGNNASEINEMDIRDRRRTSPSSPAL
jgi:hypothetical protein